MAGYLGEALARFADACREYDTASPSERPKFAKHRLILFGVAAITLDAARADRGHAKVSKNINSENEQWIALVYAIRCAPAHDISEPIWTLTNPNFRRVYNVAGLSVDLSGVDGTSFDFPQIGGVGTLDVLANFGWRNGLC
ncbi:hypothetical protein ACSBOB_20700 [Mesorhizobium sp. ASY16-5R]|uniref:hypothetical protein n=1 Tax=Mesorhizobium sp. ASY16-5R TaxID=3445772 RepID=UPI003FA00BC8